MRLSPFRRVLLVAGLSSVAGLAGTIATERTTSYSLVCEGGRRFSAENGTQRIQVVFSEEGVRIHPLSPGRSAWEWGMSLTRYGGPQDTRASGYPFLLAGDDRVDYLRGPLVEWFRNGPKGIEHGLEIGGWQGSALLRFDFTLSGSLTPKVSEDGQSVVFRDLSGAPVLAYLDLRGLDAEGREVAASWERIEHADDSWPVLRLVLHAADHAFPLRVLGRLVTAKGASRGTEVLRTAIEYGTLAAPANDLCSGAEVIPAAGPFPYLSSVVDITEATSAGDPPSPSCQANISRSVWFAFQPSTTAPYTFSVCSDAPTATTVEDTVLGLYTTTGTCTGFAEVGGGCADDTCGPQALQSAVGDVTLTAGTTYFIVAWSYGTTAPLPGAGGLQLQVVQHALPGPAPANDRCDGAEPIPGDGPFPYLTSVTADIGSATTTGDPPSPSCQPNVSRSIWYSFTPAASGRYAFSVCADGPTGTTVDDTVLAIYGATAACSGFLEAPGGCDDDSCSSEAAQSEIGGIGLSAGTRYYIVVWEYGSTAPAAGNGSIQMRVSRVATVPNDTCAAATPLLLDTPLSGTTVAAFDDTRLPSGSNCFTGIGQSPSTVAGGDVTYRFTAPVDGRYSFRVSGYDSSRNAVLYVSTDCPTGEAPALVAGCLGAANRTAVYPEEVSCLPLGAGQTVYLYVDEDALTTGSAFTIEANRCPMESEPNGSPGTATVPACGTEGSIAPAADADFFTLGTPASGSRIFALVDGVAGNSSDFDLRVTTETDTLEYDDFNNDVPFGSASPNVSGTRLSGTASYLRVSHYSPAAQAEPYRLYASVQPPALRATQEVEPNNTIAAATVGANEYYTGALSDAADVDFFSFSAAAGELVQIGLDLDPARDGTPFNGSLALLDGSGATLLMVNDPSLVSSSVAGTGSLTATAPFSPGEAMVYRIRSAGAYFVKVAGSAGASLDYLLSISHDCRVGPPSDVAVTQSDEPDPVPPGGTVTYSIVVSNLGAHPASVVTLRDEIPAGAALVTALPGQGICIGTGTVTCHLGDLAAGETAVVNLVVAAPPTPGSITNTVRVTTAVIDTSPANDLSTESTAIGTADSDGDGVADVADCAPADPAAWAVPGEATGLLFSAADTTLLQWSAPFMPGGTVVRYDLLRSATAGDFQAPTCLATDTTATSATDASVPGRTFFYLVRSENVCGGNLGRKSDGSVRTAGACP